MEAPIPDQRRVPWSASGPGELVLDSPLQHLIGREPDGIGHVPSFQRLVQRGEGKGRVGSDDEPGSGQWRAGGRPPIRLRC